MACYRRLLKEIDWTLLSFSFICIFGLSALIDSADQEQLVGNLMKLFENGGFLRQCNGLNSLDTIKQLARIINIPEFKFQIKTELITTLCQNSKTWKNLLLVNLFRWSLSSYCHFIKQGWWASRNCTKGKVKRIY